MGRNEYSGECPTPGAHRRLDEAHRLWHRCLTGYQDPEEFRTQLNACVQALRNTTFVLQSEKARIANFDEWYEPWREAMKTDMIMKWIHDARTTVVHRGDLETESRAVVRLIATYQDAATEFEEGLPSEPVELNVKPLSSLREALNELSNARIPQRVLHQSTLSIERRWVDTALPHAELLDALAYVYGFLARVVQDAHSRAGVQHRTVVLHPGQPQQLSGIEAHEGRLPCMVTTRSARTANFAMKDGRVDVGGEIWSVRPDPKLFEEATRRYKARRMRPSAFPTNALDLLPLYAENARAILLSDDEDHGWYMFFFKGVRQVDSTVLAARDAADKRALAQRLAELVMLTDIDGLIEVGESWKGTFKTDPDGVPIPAGEQADRTECLVVHAEIITGEHKTLLIPFRRRKFSRPKVEESIDITGSTYNFLDPIRAAWRKRREAK